MKTCLHRLLPIAILSLSSLAQPLSAQTMYDKSQYKNFNDVKIPQPYTPFGNRPEFNRYGDDGSKCVLDANGVLTWIGNKGEVRLLPDSSKGVPLFVTNTECLVWVNRFVDYDTYNDRPDSQLRLYRSTPESNAVTSRDVSFKGKEIIDTPQVTTTTGTLTFVSATRKDNEEETIIDTTTGATANYSDDCELRFYRLTFDAGVQFIGSRTVQITNAERFDTNTNGPEIEALGYGSDGSMAIKVIDERVQPATTNNSPEYEARTYWIDNQGRFLRVVEDQSVIAADPKIKDTKPCSRVLFVSNTRLVYEHSTTATPTVTGIQEQRRSSSAGNLLTSSIKDLTTSVEGTTLDIWNYSQVGVNRYFYTVSTDVGSAFSVSGTLTDGATAAVNVAFPDLSYAGVKNGKAHYTSDATQVAKTLWYEAVWESNRWNLKYYTTATSVSSEWRSSSAVGYPDLATGWTAVPITVGTTTRTPTGTPTVSRMSGEVASKIVRTYKLNSTGISLEKTTTLTGTLEVSPATMTGTVNTNDGSALLVTEDGDALIWLHAAGYTALPNSSQANALFVTNDQAVIWENAEAPADGDGQIPAAVVMHYNRTKTTAAPVTISSAIQADNKNISSASQSDKTVTIKLDNHGLAVGDEVEISGLTVVAPAVGAPANGSFKVTSVSDKDTFTYAVSTKQVQTFGTTTAKALSKTLVTVNATSHGLSVGERVTIAGLTGGTPANGTFVVASVIDSNNFTYKFATSQEATFGFSAATSTYKGRPIRTDGNKTLLNTSRLTPDPEYWFFTTAIKTDASTSRLTTYKLGTVEIANEDWDGDGLLDYNELNPVSPTPVTDYKNNDTDADGLEDGYELKESKTDPTVADTDGDGLKDGE
jgi:hypothetical protein